MSDTPDCKFYPMCDHRDFMIGVACAKCPWREARLEDARVELARIERRATLLRASLSTKAEAQP